MKKWKPTDEEILSFLMSDCTPELADKLQMHMPLDPDLKRRVEQIGFVHREIKTMGALDFVAPPQTFATIRLAQQLAFALLLFVAGAIFESKLEWISDWNHFSSKNQIHISEPLSWEKSDRNTFM